MLDAEHKSEERFTKLAIAYENDEEKQRVNQEVDKIIGRYDIQPQMYVTAVSSGKEVLVIEYEDDTCRESGAIFEKIIKALNITKFV